MTALDFDPGRDVSAGVARPPAPGGESAGPPTTPLVVDELRALRGELALLAHARLEARERMQYGLSSDQTDTNGDALLELFSVPGSATGHLMRATLDEAGVTPAAPDTNANLWHAIYAASGAGITDPAQVAAVGALLDFLVDDGTTPGDAKIPAAYAYDDPYSAPTLVGPGTFYLVVDGATAARRLACRWQVLVRQPEP